MNLADLVCFLQQKTCLSNLSSDILEAIASELTEHVIAAHEILIKENTAVERLYIVQRGKLSSNSQLKSHQSSLLAGTVLNLYALLLEQPTQYQVETLSETTVWSIDSLEFKQLINKYPQINQAFSQKLAAQVQQLSEKLSFEQGLIIWRTRIRKR